MHDRLDVIIICGGFGTRLRPVLGGTPKPLALVNGKPFLDWVLGQLSSGSIVNNVFLAVGYLGEQIIERFQNRNMYRFRIDFSHETTPMGTGGAVRLALDKTTTSHVLIMNGDSYLDLDLAAFAEQASSRPDAGWMAVKYMDDTQRYGNVILEADGRISAFREKEFSTGGGYINAGLYLLPRALLNKIPTDKVFSLEKDLFPVLCKEGGLYGCVCSGAFIDIGTPESYVQAGNFFKQVIS